MRNADILSIGDVYGKMLNNCKRTIRESNKNAFGDQPELVGNGPDTDGYNKALNDEKECCGHCVGGEEDNEEPKPSKRQQTTEKMKERLKDPKLSPEEKKKIQKEIDSRTAEEAEEFENVKESKKIATTTLNNIMSKSVFDKLYNKVLKENFGSDEQETDALGLDDATPDSEFGDEGFGEDDDLGGEEDSVTFTLDRATAQALVDVLQGALGGGEEDFGDEGGDELDFGDGGGDEFGGDEVDSFEEDEEVGTKTAPDKKKAFQGKDNKVSGPPKPKGGHAKSDVTDDTNTTNNAPPIAALQGKNNQVPGSTLKKSSDYFK